MLGRCVTDQKTVTVSVGQCITRNKPLVCRLILGLLERRF